ncbi:MAG: S8 family serine peptidase [Sporocytophaga sp.]|uniref:S8 family serine peptidase n=1 Tax=Sporocytophaga sp. TaxID=2231183 RepID=UPI001B073EA4|nr:S8 family serine peptidase [Sporocytophaga sp.]MBO9701090.1 S8 family serine peptidase [Sporocytophaga sp.]
MYKNYLLFILLCLFFIQTNAQSKKENTGITTNKRGRKILQNTINIKLKPGVYDSVKSGKLNLQPELKKLLKQAQIEEVKPMFTNLDIQPAHKRKFCSGIERLHTIKYSSNSTIEEIIELLMKTGYVEYAEPVFVEELLYIPNDPKAQPYTTQNDTSQFYLSRIKAYEAWDIHKGDTNTVIGIIDTGVRPTHEDLKDNIKRNWNDPIDNIDNDQDGYIDNFMGWDLGDGDNDPTANGSPHGTEVSSLSSATGDNGKGGIGTGFKCKFLPIKASPSNAGGAIAYGYQGLVYAARQGCKVANLSWGGTGEYSQATQDIINYAALEKDVLVLAAAGNSGKEQDFYPASYDNVLSVASCDTIYSPSAGKLIETRKLTYSTNVDIIAQGINITIASNSGDNLYLRDGGSSFSTPIVAGAAALVRSKFPNLSAIQAAELIRVTADVMDTFPENLAFRGKMGKGRLNMFRALTDSISPAIRIANYTYKGLFGAYTYGGDTANLSIQFKNYLQPSSANLEVTMSCDASFVQIKDDKINIGAINTLQTIEKNDDVFSLIIDKDAPNNSLVKFRFDFKDPSTNYIDYQYITILINPDFRIVDTNRVNLTVAGNGRLGHSDKEMKRGEGMIFQGSSMIYESGLMIATDKNTVSDCVRTDQYNTDEDFEATKSISFVKPIHSNEETYAEYQDMSPIGTKVKVKQRTYAWKNTPNDSYVIIEYNIQNASGNTIDSLYTGLFTDWDINDYNYNRADYDYADSIGYCYNTFLNGLYGGVAILTKDKPVCFSMDNGNIAGTINPNDKVDGFTSQEKFTTLSKGIGRKQAGASGAGYDVSQVVGVSLYNIKNDESRTIAFAFIAAENLYDLKMSSRAARSKYHEIKKSPLPVVQSSYSFCKGEKTDITITPTNGNTFNFYKSPGPPNLLYTGSEYHIGNLAKTDTIFISNVDSLFESNLAKVALNFYESSRADFSVIPDTVVDINSRVYFVDQSSNSVNRLWDFGNGNTSNASLASYTYDSPGAHDVKLIAENKYGCNDTITKIITVRVATSINVSNEGLVNIYPNPVENNLTLNLSQLNSACTISIINMLGEEVFTEYMDTQVSNKEINTSNLTSGVYLLKIVSGNNTLTKKFNKL